MMTYTNIDRLLVKVSFKNILFGKALKENIFIVR